MLISFDKTNFPLMVIEGLGLEVHLLPITKFQYAQFVAGEKRAVKANFKKMLALNPSIDSASFSAHNRERLFISGLLPAEALAFANWLGEGYDLPTVSEWRNIYSVLNRMALPMHNLADELVSGPAGQIIAQLWEDIRIPSMLNLSLMTGGLVEWVQDDAGWAGLGAPRSRFHPNLWNPLQDLITPHQSDERLPYFGFRLVKRGKWFLADEGAARFIY